MGRANICADYLSSFASPESSPLHAVSVAVMVSPTGIRLGVTAKFKPLFSVQGKL